MVGFSSTATHGCACERPLHAVRNFSEFIILTFFRHVHKSLLAVMLLLRLHQLKSPPSWKRESEVFPRKPTWTRPEEFCLLGMYKFPGYINASQDTSISSTVWTSTLVD